MYVMSMFCDVFSIRFMCVVMTFPCHFAMQLCYSTCAISGDICYRLYVTLCMLCVWSLYDVVLRERFGFGFGCEQVLRKS